MATTTNRVVVRRIAVADLAGVLDDEYVWRECEFDPAVFLRFAHLKGAIQTDLQRIYGLLRIHFVPSRRSVKAFGVLAHVNDLFQDLPGLRIKDGEVEGATRAKGAPLKATEETQVVLLETEYPDAALVLEVLNRTRVMEFEKELGVRAVKGLVQGREDDLRVWYQGVLHEVATAHYFVQLGIAARKGTPKEIRLDLFGMTRYRRQDSVNFKQPTIYFNASLYTLVRRHHKLDWVKLVGRAPTAGQGLGMIPTPSTPAPVHRPAPPIEQQGQQHQEKTQRSSEYQKQSAAQGDDERKLPARGAGPRPPPAAHQHHREHGGRFQGVHSFGLFDIGDPYAPYPPALPPSMSHVPPPPRGAPRAPHYQPRPPQSTGAGPSSLFNTDARGLHPPTLPQHVPSRGVSYPRARRRGAVQEHQRRPPQHQEPAAPPPAPLSHQSRPWLFPHVLRGIAGSRGIVDDLPAGGQQRRHPHPSRQEQAPAAGSSPWLDPMYSPAPVHANDPQDWWLPGMGSEAGSSTATSPAAAPSRPRSPPAAPRAAANLVPSNAEPPSAKVLWRAVPWEHWLPRGDSLSPAGQQQQQPEDQHEQPTGPLSTTQLADLGIYPPPPSGFVPEDFQGRPVARPSTPPPQLPGTGIPLPAHLNESLDTIMDSLYSGKSVDDDLNELLAYEPLGGDGQPLLSSEFRVPLPPLSTTVTERVFPRLAAVDTVVGLLQSVTSQGLPAASFLDLKAALAEENTGPDLFSTLLYLVSLGTDARVKRAALVALARLCKGTSQQTADVLRQMGKEEARFLLYNAMSGLMTPPMGVLDDREAASALLDVGTLAMRLPRPSLSLCTGLCDRVLDVLKLHRRDNDMELRACALLDTCTHTSTTREAEEDDTTLDTHLASYDFHLIMLRLLEAHEGDAFYAKVVPQIVTRVNDKVVGMDTRQSWGLLQLLHQNLLKWKRNKKIHKNTGEAIQVLQAMGVTEPRVPYISSISK